MGKTDLTRESADVPKVGDLLSLAAFRPIFENPHFVAGTRPDVAIGSGEFTLDGIVYGEAALQFERACYDGGWVRSDIDWSCWQETSEARDLWFDEQALSAASAEQLAKLLTLIIRQNRFVGGLMFQAFEEGPVLRIVRRAEALLEVRQAIVADS